MQNNHDLYSLLTTQQRDELLADAPAEIAAINARIDAELDLMRDKLDMEEVAHAIDEDPENIALSERIADRQHDETRELRIIYPQDYERD